MNAEEIISNFKEKGFIEIPITISKAEIDNAAEIFLEFLKVPLEEKELIKQTIPLKNLKGELEDFGNDKGNDYGYYQKLKNKGDLDNKQFFHYNPYLESILPKILETADKRTIKFIEVAREFYKKAESIAKPIIKEIDTKFPGTYEILFPENELPRSPIRFLSYYKEAQGDFIAKGHYDKSIFTLAIGENKPGLKIGFDEESLKEITHKENQAIFFPSLSSLAISNNKFKPAWHEVIQKSGDEVNETCTRWAIVFFIAPTKIIETITHKKAHKIM